MPCNRGRCGGWLWNSVTYCTCSFKVLTRVRLARELEQKCRRNIKQDIKHFGTVWIEYAAALDGGLIKCVGVAYRILARCMHPLGYMGMHGGSSSVHLLMTNSARLFVYIRKNDKRSLFLHTCKRSRLEIVWANLTGLFSSRKAYPLTHQKWKSARLSEEMTREPTKQ